MAGFIMMYIFGLLTVFAYPMVFPLFYGLLLGLTGIVFSDILDASDVF